MTELKQQQDQRLNMFTPRASDLPYVKTVSATFLDEAKAIIANADITNAERNVRLQSAYARRGVALRAAFKEHMLAPLTAEPEPAPEAGEDEE